MGEKPECREVGGSPSDGQYRLCANSDHLGPLALVVSGNSNGLGALTLVVHVALDDLGGGVCPERYGSPVGRAGSVWTNVFLYAKRSNIYRS